MTISAGTDTGFQLLVPDMTVTGYNFYTPSGSATRVHTFRFLRYLTTGTTNATITYGNGQTASLTGTSGAWSSYDMSQIPAIGYVSLYSISSVVAAFETIS